MHHTLRCVAISKNVTRATGLSTAYAIGVSVFGGTMAVHRYRRRHWRSTSPAWYVTLTTAFASWALTESRGRELEG